MSDGGGKGVGGTASSRTTTVPNGKLRGGRRKQRRPDGRHERARSRSPKESAAGKGLRRSKKHYANAKVRS